MSIDFVGSSEKLVNDAISEVFNKIAEKVEPTYSRELANFAKEIFDSAGHANGREWQPNADSTVKRKGFNHRNVEDGVLEQTITEEGFLMQDDYMDELISLNEGYEYANAVGDGQNRFDDIGKRPEDQEEIMQRTVKDIVENYK